MTVQALPPYHDDPRRRAIVEITRSIHHSIPERTVDTASIGDYELRKGYLNSREITRLIVYLRSSGCQWMLDDSMGGCNMCGHLAGTTKGKTISASDYLVQFQSIVSQFDFSSIPMLCLYNAGSFLNDSEMPSESRKAIYESIDRIEGIEHVIIESRPEYVTKAALADLRSALDKHVEVGIGLESSSELVRQVALNKGFALSAFEEAIARCHEREVSALAYVLLKPPFLSEQAAIDDAVSSIHWAFDHGVDVVSLEPVSVQKGTLIHLLHNMQLYRPPWIWSVLSVIQRVHSRGLVRVGGFEFFPPPTVCTHNCSACNELCIDAIECYNATNDIRVIDQALATDCKTCKADWEHTIRENSEMRDNIDAFLVTYDETAIQRFMRNDLRSYPSDLLRIGACGAPNV